MAKHRLSKEEIAQKLENESKAVQFAALVFRALPGEIQRFEIEEPYTQPSLTPGYPSEARHVMLHGVFLGENREFGGFVAFETCPHQLQPFVRTHEIGETLQRYRDNHHAEPAVGCSMYDAFLRALQRLDDAICERQSEQAWPRSKKAS